MTGMTRRRFTKQSLAVLGGAAAWQALGPAQASMPQRERLEKVAPRASLAIAASPLGIGFETLDRRLFLPERTYELLARLGVKWARVQTGWCRCETEKGRFNFAWLDEIVDSLIRIGIQPWFNLGYGNRLYTPEAPHESAVGWAPTHTEEARQAWLRFVRAAGEHFASRVRHWEIWNEPNGSGFWRPEKPSPAGYVDLVKLTAPELRARVPGAVLIGGALAGTPTTYLDGCLELGLAEQVDRISYHPYQLLPESGYAACIAGWREKIGRRNPKAQLWQAECGCPSTDNGIGALTPLPWNESRQARWLLRRTLNDLRLKLEHISWYNVADQVRYSAAFSAAKAGPAAQATDFGTGAKKTARTDAHFGLLRVPDYVPKPSYFAYQTLCALFDTQTEMADLPMQFAGDFNGEPAISAAKIEQASFVRGGRPLVAYWYPADVLKDTPARPVDVTLTLPFDLALTEPVLVDPTSGDVFKLEGKVSGRQCQFTSLPLTDYPILVTEKKVALGT